MKYIATREGVEVLTGKGPATDKQKEMVAKLLKDFPDVRDSFEYEDYKQAPTLHTASALISAALDSHMQNLQSENGYLKYIATRPGAEKHGAHGLFGREENTNLTAAMHDLTAHDGNVWTIIYSLHREDAERLGYNNAAAWRKLLVSQQNKFAEAFHVPSDSLHWYAAYHDADTHPHIHMMVWTEQETVLKRDAVVKLRSAMTNSIFQAELENLYIQKDAAYKDVTEAARAVMHNLVDRMESVSDPPASMPDHHEAIVSREQYNAVKAEMARRSALRSPSKAAVTGRSCYTSKYALSDRIVCGECGTLYRRCTWTSRGRKYPVWRCTSRLNYGTKYCHDSPTIKEEPLQNAILAAINSAMSNKPALLDLIKNAVSLELLPVQGQTMSLADIERRLTQLDEQFQRLLAEAIDAEDKESCNTQFAGILAEQTALKKQKEGILQSSTDADRVCTRMKQAEQAIESTASTITEWNENAVRQIVECVTVLSADEVLVRIKSGAEIKQRLER